MFHKCDEDMKIIRRKGSFERSPTYYMMLFVIPKVIFCHLLLGSVVILSYKTALLQERILR